MGYQTDFNGSFTLDKPLTEPHKAYLLAFSESRRMKRNAEVAAKLPDPLRDAVALPIGAEGAYYVAGDDSTSVTNTNLPPDGQPGVWCQWIPSEDGEEIVWDDGEKFYHYDEWITYLIDNFLKPWGYVLGGEVEWRGEEWDDHGTMSVQNNVLVLS